jgi:hypothetical protein
MGAELSPFEEVGQPPYRRRARVERVERALHILERSLRRPSWQSDGAKSVLHAGVRGHDRSAQVGVGAQVVERLVERLGHRFRRRGKLRQALSFPSAEHDCNCDRNGEQGEDDHDFEPDDVRAGVGRRMLVAEDLAAAISRTGIRLACTRQVMEMVFKKGSDHDEAHQGEH